MQRADWPKRDVDLVPARAHEIVGDAVHRMGHRFVIIRRTTMFGRSSIGIAALAATLSLATIGVQAQGSKYPDWSGAWGRFAVPGLGGQPSFDQTKPWGRGQQAPLTAEY